METSKFLPSWCEKRAMFDPLACDSMGSRGGGKAGEAGGEKKAKKEERIVAIVVFFGF